MNYLDSFLKQLCLDKNEHFFLYDNSHKLVGEFYFDDRLYLIEHNSRGDSYSNFNILRDVLVGNLAVKKMPFLPKNGEIFYYNTDEKVNSAVFDEKMLLHKSLRALKVVYKTKEQAVNNFTKDLEKWCI